MKRLLKISFLILLFSFVANAQWIQQNSGTTVILRAVKAVDNNIIWAAGSNGLVLNTTDGGTTWNIKTPTQTGYHNLGIAAFDINTALVIGSTFPGGTAKIWKTTDAGNIWMEKYYSSNNFSDNIHFFDSNNGVYLGDSYPLNSSQWNILTTTDQGNSWNRVPQSNYPPSDSVCAEYGLLRSYGAFGDTVWFSTYYDNCSTKNNRIFRSTDKGYNWTAFNMPYQGYTAGYISFSSSTYGIAISNPFGRVARSTDAGATWEALDTIGITPWSVRNVPGYANFFLAVGEDASANGKSYYSDDGNFWNSISVPTQSLLTDVSSTKDYAWSVGWNGTILKLNIESIIPDPSPDTLHVPAEYSAIQSAIDAATNGDIVLVAEGTYYENINFKGKAITVASHFIVDGNETHIANTIINGSQASHPDSGSIVFFISGEDTNSVLCGFTVTGGTGTLYGVPPIIGRAGGGIVVLGSGASIKNNIIEYNTIEHSTDAWGGGIFARAEDGRNFNVVNNLVQNNSINTPYVDYNCLGGGIYTYSSGNVLIANNKVIENSITAPEAYGGGISPYGGGNCSVVGNFVSGNILNATTGGSGGIDIYYKLILRNNLLVNNSAPNGGGMWIEFSNNNASLSGGRGIITELPGKNNNSQSIFAVDALFENNTLVNNTATVAGGGIRVFGGSIPELMNFIIWGNTASTGSQIYGTADVQYSDVEGGWPGIGNIDMDPLFRDVANDDYHLMSTDCGNSFNSPCIDAGNPAYYDSLLACDWNLGEVRSDMGAYSLAKLIVGVEGETETIPTEYSLSQNYPNPFNPNTKINYQTPQNGFVILKVYDVLGNEIATLVNEEKSAGTYEVEVDASNLSSGIYFYQLQSGNYIETKKMILLK